MNDKLIKKIFVGMFWAQVFNFIATFSAVFVDSAVIGTFLGEEAMAAYGIAAPIATISMALCGGLGMSASLITVKFFSVGDIKKANNIFTETVVIGIIFSLILVLLGVLFVTPITGILGGNKVSNEIFNMSSAYLKAYFVIFPAIFFNSCCISVLQMDGDKKRVLIGILSGVAVNVVFDFLNALVFHKGMAGMAIATVASAFVTSIVELCHFFKKNSMIRFRFKELNLKEPGCFFMLGLPFSAHMLALTALTACLNRILLLTEHSTHAVAAMAAVVTVGNIVKILADATGATLLLVGNVFYSEEDRSSLLSAFKYAIRYGLLLYIVVIPIVLITAPLIMNVFFTEHNLAYQIAVYGIRLFAVSMFFFVINEAARSFYQIIGKHKYTYLCVFLCDFFALVVIAFVLRNTCDGMGVFKSYVIGYGVSWLLMSTFIFIKNRQSGISLETFSLLDKDFGGKIDDCYEYSIENLEDAVACSKDVGDFVFAKTTDKRLAYFVALALEERTVNIIQYGFIDNKSHSIDVRLVHNEDEFILSIRDDCNKFNPKEYIRLYDNEVSYEHCGFKIIAGISKSMSYVNNMNLNNFVIRF